MNYLKIQTDILKALCKDNVNKVLQRVAKSEDGNEIYFISGSHLYILQKDFLFLDYERLVYKTGELQNNTLQNILKGADKANQGTEQTDLYAWGP